jgi:signal transduction histidine kinase
VTNVVKHAACDQVAVRVTTDQALVRVVVADEGVGGADATGHGLQGLADRVAALGGTMTIRSPATQGTRVEAVLPCAW